MTPITAEGAAGLTFILGFPRSGTTLLGQILAGNPAVAVLVEKPLLAKAITDFMDIPEGLTRLAAQSSEDLEVYRADFWRLARGHGIALEGKRVVEQTALNTVHLPLIERLFPDAAIVFAIRDPRDVVLSCFRRQFAPTRFTLEFRDLESTARFYDATMRLAEACRNRLGLRILDVRNEDVIAEFEPQVRRLCDFCGVSWSEAMRDFQDAAADRQIGTRSAAQIRRGLTSEGVGIWRRYRAQIEPVLPLLAPWVVKFGYSED